MKIYIQLVVICSLFAGSIYAMQAESTQQTAIKQSGRKFQLSEHL